MGRRTRALVSALVIMTALGCGKKEEPHFYGFPSKSARIQIDNETQRFRSAENRACSFTKLQRRTENFISLEARFEKEGSSLLFRSSQGQCGGAVRTRNLTQFRFVTGMGSFQTDNVRDGDCTLEIKCDSSDIDAEGVTIKRVEVTFTCLSLPLTDGSRKKVVTEFLCD